ncbi:MAG: response regulator [Opitutaceae bacterium]
MTKTPKIMVVDDQPVNILLMRKKLEYEGMEVVTADSGQQCLDIVGTAMPDLILLDIMMPGMDGVQVCAALKQREDTRSIPVIFLTARDGKASKLEGLSVGAVDYITKPVDLEETLARVRSQLRFHAMFKENLELTQRLGEARRAASLGALSQGISHNLNNLLGVIYGYLELAKMSTTKPDLLGKHLNKIDDAVVRMTKIIRQVTAVSTQARLIHSPTSIEQLIEGAVNRFRQEHRVPARILVEDHASDTVVQVNVEVFEDAVSKLLINAWESYGENAPEEAVIIIEAALSQREGQPVVQFAIHDRGNGLDPVLKDSVFEPFVSTKSTVGVGMGLTIARNGIRNLGGEVTLQPGPDGGTTALFYLPIARTATATAA